VFLTVDSQSSSVPPSSEVELAKPKVEHHLHDPPFPVFKKKPNFGQVSFFQKKEQVGKAPIFGSLTNDYHQVSKNWFSHISGVLKKIIERTNQGTSPETRVICWVFRKAPWNWGLEQNLKKSAQPGKTLKGLP
jgi:hypothetical protein